MAVHITPHPVVLSLAVEVLDDVQRTALRNMSSAQARAKTHAREAREAAEEASGLHALVNDASAHKASARKAADQAVDRAAEEAKAAEEAEAEAAKKAVEAEVTKAREA